MHLLPFSSVVVIIVAFALWNVMGLYNRAVPLATVCFQKFDRIIPGLENNKERIRHTTVLPSLFTLCYLHIVDIYLIQLQKIFELIKLVILIPHWYLVRTCLRQLIYIPTVNLVTIIYLYIHLGFLLTRSGTH